MLAPQVQGEKPFRENPAVMQTTALLLATLSGSNKNGERCVEGLVSRQTRTRAAFTDVHLQPCADMGGMCSPCRSSAASCCSLHNCHTSSLCVCVCVPAQHTHGVLTSLFQLFVCCVLQNRM